MQNLIWNLTLLSTKLVKVVYENKKLFQISSKQLRLLFRACVHWRTGSFTAVSGEESALGAWTRISWCPRRWRELWDCAGTCSLHHGAHPVPRGRNCIDLEDLSNMGRSLFLSIEIEHFWVVCAESRCACFLMSSDRTQIECGLLHFKPVEAVREIIKTSCCTRIKPRIVRLVQCLSWNSCCVQIERVPGVTVEFQFWLPCVIVHGISEPWKNDKRMVHCGWNQCVTRN